MSEAKKSYQQIIKATSLFGGVQIVNILISLIRSKVIAVLLGPVGMGIAGLINTTINSIDGFTKLGLDISAVKEISSAEADSNVERSSIVISSLNRLIWFTGILASLICALFSPFLSQLSFGNDDYTFAFIWVSIALLFKQLTTGKTAILQGLRKRKYLAKANLYGSFFGLLITVPLYYYFGIDAIVPAIIISTIIAFLFSWYFSNKLKLPLVKISNKDAFIEGKSMIKLGLMLSIMSVITLVTTYLIQIFISHYGGLDEVGFYLAGFVIVNSYVGMVFNAMQADYFPKLSAISEDIVKIRQSVTEQAIVGVLIVTPIIVVFLTTTPFLIELLYSKEFLVIVGMVSWGILGTLFKAVSFSMGYVILAKGDSGLFIKTSVVFNLLLLISSLLGYYLDGLTGVGIGFLIYYGVHFIGLKVITLKRYGLYFSREFNYMFLICLLVCAFTFLCSFLQNPWLKYSLMISMSLISIIFTIYQIDKKIGIIETIKGLINNKNDHKS
jgi:O-antigen/teichoic acid export membrane protein